MHSSIALLLIGDGGRWGDILGAIWLVVIVLSAFVIPREVRVRFAERFGLGIRARPGEPGLPPSPKVRKLIILLNVILFSGLILSWPLR
jgi:hypothetical protein